MLALLFASTGNTNVAPSAAHIDQRRAPLESAHDPKRSKLDAKKSPASAASANCIGARQRIAGTRSSFTFPTIGPSTITAPKAAAWRAS
jgi:hypothetical protein